MCLGKCREHYWGETEPPSRLWLYWEWASPCHAQSLSWANFPSVYPLNPHNVPVRPMLIVPVFADEETRTQRSYMTRSSSQSLWRVEMGFQTRNFDFGVWALDFQIKRNVLNTINLEYYSPSWLFRMVVLRLGCTDDPLEGPWRQAVPGHAHLAPVSGSMGMRWTQELALPTSPQVLLMMLVQGRNFENHSFKTSVKDFVVMIVIYLSDHFI